VEDLAGSFNDLGALLRATGRHGNAERAYLEARGLLRQLVERQLGVAAYRQKLAATYNNLGNVLADLQGPAAAEEPLRQALAYREKLAKDFPSVLAYRQEVAGTHNNLAAVLAAAKRYPDAEKECATALALQKKLVEDFPGVPDFEGHLAAVLDNSASIHLGQGQLDKARELLREARIHHDKVNADQPLYRQFRRKHYLTLADTLLRQGEKGDAGKHAEAAATAGEFIKLFPDSAEDYRLAAIMLTRCSTLAGKDAKLTDADRKRLTETYAARAVQMLREALARGWSNIVQLKTGAVFAPLRLRDDFQKLVVEIEKK
jgi:tetratricopeptide (TPR) repeat protein